MERGELRGLVLRRACQQLRRWQTELSNPDLSMSVNVSVVQLRGTGFVSEVASTIRESGIRPASLTLEVTESTLMDDIEPCLDRLHAAVLDPRGDLRLVARLAGDVAQRQRQLRQLVPDGFSHSEIRIVRSGQRPGIGSKAEPSAMR